MKRILMNKNKKVLLAEYDKATGVFTNIYEIYDINYAPYILKSSYLSNDINETLQPFNEVLASEIFKRLGFNHVEYILDIYKDIVVSKCPCFITKDTELITCYQIYEKI